MSVKINAGMVAARHGLARRIPRFHRIFLKSQTPLELPLQSNKAFQILIELPYLH